MRFLFLFVIFSYSAVSAQTLNTPWNWDFRLLEYSKRQIESGAPGFVKAYRQLLNDADRHLTSEMLFVTSKTLTPPSGDKHDYMSFGVYWWPNPDTPDGLPYIRKDGQHNPAINEAGDGSKIEFMIDAVRTLALAYFFSGNERYAEHAAKQLRVWFFDDKTRMNPNLNFGQAIPGRVDGRAEGIIDTKDFVMMLDGALLLNGSGSWTTDDEKKLGEWFARYLDWLMTQPLGIEESKKKNNHGTWYDTQAAAMALYSGQKEKAERIIRDHTLARLPQQITDDGGQPHELSRTNSFGYSTGNLCGFYVTATYAERASIDLWNVRNTAGKPYLQAALDFLIPAYENPSEWKHEQIGGFNGMDAKMLYLLRMASEKYADPKYKALYEKRLTEKHDGTLLQLLLPVVKQNHF